MDGLVEVVNMGLIVDGAQSHFRSGCPHSMHIIRVLSQYQLIFLVHEGGDFEWLETMSTAKFYQTSDGEMRET